MAEQVSERPRARRVTDWLVTAVLMLLVAALYVWLDFRMDGGPPPPRSAAQWAGRIAAAVVFYGGLGWVLRLPHRVLRRDPPRSLLPASKRTDREGAV